MRRAGFTLLELLVTVAIFGAIVAALAGVLATASHDSTLLTNQGGLDERAWRVVDEVARELRFAQGSSLLVTQQNGSSRLDFQVPTGYANGAVVLSTPITLAAQLSNFDADHDHKKTDDYALVRVQDGVSRVLCDAVPFGGFAVTTSGSNVAVDLQLATTDAQHRAVRARVAESVSTRN
jgi:prepilin-type N-terminal cleavage/methylation domain-containing protein